MLASMDLRGQEFKRFIRAAAALQGLFDDTAIARAIGRSRNTVASWWLGARPEPDALEELAEATALPVDELSRYVYFGGPIPPLVEPGSAVESAIREGIRRDQERRPPEDPPAQPPSPKRPSRGTAAGSS